MKKIMFLFLFLFLYREGDAVADITTDGVSQEQALERLVADAAGNAEAQLALGLFYKKAAADDGQKHKRLEAIKWFRLAAEQGNTEAQIQLGAMYFIAEGKERDINEARRWWRLGAERGDGRAQYLLGLSYYRCGLFCGADHVEAYMWLNLAAAQGTPDAANMRDTLGRQLQPRLKVIAQQKSSEWTPKTE